MRFYGSDVDDDEFADLLCGFFKADMQTLPFCNTSRHSIHMSVRWRPAELKDKQVSAMNVDGGDGDSDHWVSWWLPYPIIVLHGCLGGFLTPLIIITIIL